MKTLYLDIFSGISGDMFIGALLDIGVEAGMLENELRKLGLGGYHLHVRHGEKQSIAGTKFDVHIEGELHHNHDHAHQGSGAHHHHHPNEPHSHEHAHEHGAHQHHPERSFSAIRELIEKSALSDWVKERSVAVFRRIAVAEGAIHGVPAEQVHFHEVGAVDSIVDVVGACIALEMLGKPRVLAAQVVEGAGFVKCAHGTFPIPAPATLSILAQRQVPVSQCNETNELITPTGAAILAEFAESFGPLQDFAAEKIGFGLGTRENKTRPNVLRVMLGKAAAASSYDWETDRIAVLETNLDNISGELLGQALDSAMAKGALDAFHTPVQMKKNRPGVIFTILCEEERADEFSEFLMRETSALGVRRTTSERRKLRREFVKVQTSYGEVTVKLGKLNGNIVQSAPEFESCRVLAERAGVPLKEVYAAALSALRDAAA